MTEGSTKRVQSAPTLHTIKSVSQLHVHTKILTEEIKMLHNNYRNIKKTTTENSKIIPHLALCC